MDIYKCKKKKNTAHLRHVDVETLSFFVLCGHTSKIEILTNTNTGVKFSWMKVYFVKSLLSIYPTPLERLLTGCNHIMILV